MLKLGINDNIDIDIARKYEEKKIVATNFTYFLTIEFANVISDQLLPLHMYTFAVLH